ncbi:Rv3654c family TadE-like protein [Paenarthrobacter sp. S56]|uniref:Rv3654c family TadE-like protein n=1 Tax=Paenarthrobacter sp. S56 TaxID=3138179 RepID=UPI00321B8824
MTRGEQGPGERGSGTVLALALVAVVGVLLVALMLLAQAGVMASRAASASDLAALAGADAARGLTTGEPCAVAAQVAEHHEAHLTSCAVKQGGVVDVSAELSGPFQYGTATGRSRAGPPP